MPGVTGALPEVAGDSGFAGTLPGVAGDSVLSGALPGAVESGAFPGALPELPFAVDRGAFLATESPISLVSVCVGFAAAGEPLALTDLGSDLPAADFGPAKDDVLTPVFLSDAGLEADRSADVFSEGIDFTWMKISIFADRLQQVQPPYTTYYIRYTIFTLRPILSSPK
ncbi:hypothetical protein DWB63_02795 [Pseudodesulfovibrio sp. S3]|nr:hypothetical protein DWB63_02795 [Pseudodesulfovibrio sp. S3]